MRGLGKSQMPEQTLAAKRSPPQVPWAKWLLGLVILVAVLVASYQFRGELSLTSLAAREVQLRAWQTAHPVLAIAIAFVLYVLVTGLSLPGAAAMSILYGWLFGFGSAVVLVSFASTTGATLAFLLGRYLLGDWIQNRFAAQLTQFNANLDREGAWYLLTLRLIPAVPFFVINLVMGLTRMRVFTFWWVSQAGMFPATCIFVWAGSTVPTLHELAQQGLGSVLRPQLFAALAALGLLPLALRGAMRWAKQA